VILLDARMAGARLHGIARYAEGLVPALSEIASGETFLTLVPRGLRPSSPLARCPHARTAIPLYGASEQVLLPRLIRRLAPRLFHSLTYTAPLASPVPAIPTIHDLIHLRFPTRLAPLQAAYYESVVGRVARRAPAVITVSEATRQAIVERLRVPEERIAVTPLAADRRFLDAGSGAGADAAEVRARHHLPADYVLFVGNPRPHKNAAGALRIHGLLGRAHGLESALVIVGLSADGADAGHRGRALFLPAFPDEDLPGLYRGARALLLPSLDEGFGLPALEAMACGTPVVAARRGGLPEVVGEAGLLEDPEDEEAFAAALARALSDTALAEALREKGRERAGGFSWSETARRTLAAYAAALEEL
jgi:glycosyltransferase involved in cell wall biosynthesis